MSAFWHKADIATVLNDVRRQERPPHAAPHLPQDNSQDVARPREPARRVPPLQGDSTARASLLPACESSRARPDDPLAGVGWQVLGAGGAADVTRHVMGSRK